LIVFVRGELRDWNLSNGSPEFDLSNRTTCCCLLRGVDAWPSCSFKNSYLFLCFLTIFFQQLRFIIGQCDLRCCVSFLLTEQRRDRFISNLLIRAARFVQYFEDTDSKICRSSSLIFPFHRRHGGGIYSEIKINFIRRPAWLFTLLMIGCGCNVFQIK
jgi:hypothetical protein